MRCHAKGSQPKRALVTAISDSVPAEQSHVIMRQRLFQPHGKGPVPRIIAKHKAKQHTDWRSSLCCKIRQIGRNQFPSDIRRICI